MLKAAPLMILAATAQMNQDKIRHLINHAAAVATQSEANEITCMILMDRIADNPLPTPETFAEYLKTNMRVNNVAGLVSTGMSTPDRVKEMVPDRVPSERDGNRVFGLSRSTSN